MPRTLSDLLVVDLLHRASQGAENAFECRVGLDLNARQYAVLRVIAKSEGLSQTAIVEATGIDRSTVAEMVRRLTERGWVQRRRARDARAYAVRLTRAGKETLASAGPASRETEASIVASVRSLGRDQLRDALIELIKAAETAERPTSRSGAKRLA